MVCCLMESATSLDNNRRQMTVDDCNVVVRHHVSNWLHGPRNKALNQPPRAVAADTSHQRLHLLQPEPGSPSIEISLHRNGFIRNLLWI